MWGSIIEGFFAVITGGAGGLIGSVVSKILGIWEARERRRDRMIEFEHEIKRYELQAKMRRAEMESDQAIAETYAWGDARTASYSHDSSYGVNWLTPYMRLVRPILTIALIIVCFVIFLTSDEATRYTLANQMIFLLSMAIAWWFGERNKKGVE